MDPFLFEYSPDMGFNGTTTDAGLNCQGQQVHSIPTDYESRVSHIHNEYAASDQTYNLSFGSEPGMGLVVGLRRNMGLGITNMDASNVPAMSINMHMNVYADDMNTTSPSLYSDIDGATLYTQNYLSPLPTLTPHELQPAITCPEAIFAAGATHTSSTLPIPIPVPKHHFRSAPQLSLSPIIQSSPTEQPWCTYYFSESPAASASSTSFQSDDFAYRPLRSLNSLRPMPVSPSPSTPGSILSPASLAERHAAEDFALPQRVRRTKPTQSFECEKCGRSFTRGADVKRHEVSVHSPQPMDCPVESCVRKGTIGFPRRDHLVEHLRTFHNQHIPKRIGNRKRKANALLDN